MSELAITAYGLVKQFKGGRGTVTAVGDLSLEVAPARRTA